MTFEADSPLVDVVEPSLGYRREKYEPRTRPAVAFIVHTTGSGPLRRAREGQFADPFEAALAIYRGMMNAGPHYVLEGDSRARLAQVCPEDRCAWAVGGRGGGAYRLPYERWGRLDTLWWGEEFLHLESPRQLAGGLLWRPYDAPKGWRDKLRAAASKARWWAWLARGSVNANVVHLEVTPPSSGARDPWSAQTWARFVELVGDVAQRHTFQLRRETVLSHSEAHPRARSRKTAGGGEGWDPSPEQWSWEQFAAAAGIPLWCPPGDMN